VHILEGVGKRHHGVRHKLQLRLELRVGLRQPLLASAGPGVVAIIGSRKAARVTALKVALPELWKGRVSEFVKKRTAPG
jgi:hypothetical protein